MRALILACVAAAACAFPGRVGPYEEAARAKPCSRAPWLRSAARPAIRAEASPGGRAGRCPPYLGTGENGLPRCDMQAGSQDYLSGSWQLPPRLCRPSRLADLADLAYSYQEAGPCAGQPQCHAVGDPCRACAPDPAHS